MSPHANTCFQLACKWPLREPSTFSSQGQSSRGSSMWFRKAVAQVTSATSVSPMPPVPYYSWMWSGRCRVALICVVLSSISLSSRRCASSRFTRAFRVDSITYFFFLPFLLRSYVASAGHRCEAVWQTICARNENAPLVSLPGAVREIIISLRSVRKRVTFSVPWNLQV